MLCGFGIQKTTTPSVHAIYNQDNNLKLVFSKPEKLR
jgi:hypothetical protein